MDRNTLLKTLAVSLLTPVLFAACTTQQQQQRPAPAPAPAPAPKPEPPTRSGDYGPSYMTYDEGGRRWVKGSMAFPTGLRQSSGLLLEKIVPAEVAVGQVFEYRYNVINLTDYKIEDVTVTDQLSAGFNAAGITPKADKIDGNTAKWTLGELGPKETKTIKVSGTASQEGTITTCGMATYNPVLCEPIKVTKPALQLAKSAPAEALTCDPIPMKLTVRNSGSSVLHNVRVVDTLPNGLSTGSPTSFDAGTLAPGASKEFSFNATAARTGKYVNNAKATSDEGVVAEASSTTTVHQPVLAIACEAPAERFLGRPIEVCFTVSNKGDAPSANSTVEVTVPAGLTVSSTTGGGTASGGKVSWNVGSLAPNGSTKVCFTATASTVGDYQFAASTKGTCAAVASTSCQTRVIGIPAILLEVVDLEDPIEVGKNVTYVIDVTNQGSAPDTDIKLVCTLEDAQEFVSGSGPTPVTGSGKTITMGALPTLGVKQKATWRVVVKAAKASNVRFKTTLTSQQLTRPVEETESTNQY